jgi:cation diffusion facilitator CzcD-associated flavoprotein CzcO
VTQPPVPCHRVVVDGAGDGARAALQAAGVTDVVTLGRDVLSSRFDGATDTWLLATSGGEALRARVVVTDRPAQVPWLPDIAGRDDFLGESFHAAQWPAGFDPAGMRVAVVGADSTAGHHVPRLMKSAASVTVFAHPPRRVVDELPLPATRAKRWLLRRARPAAAAHARPALVRSPVIAITASRIRTADGVEHDADAIVYGTGFALPDPMPGPTLVGADGVTARQAWADGMEPYFGVAVRGLPNYFFIGGPDTGAQARYVAECVALMERNGNTRIEVRRSSQRVFNERVYVRSARPQRVMSAFDLTSGARGDDATYEGAATLTIAGSEHPVRVRLAGHLNPIDGTYHWQGTIFGSAALPDESLKQARTATLTVGERSAPARIIEQTPWGTHTVAGVGAPPYALT